MKDSKYEEALERAKQGLPIDKIFPELNESEDERIRMDICTWLKHKRETCTYPTPKKETLSTWISYLERQKEPLIPEEKMNHPLYLEGFDVGKKVGEVLKEQQPAEWSEEDERIPCNVIAYVGYAAGQRGVKDDLFKEANDWLKSLRPQPSLQPNINHAVWHNASEEKPTRLPIIHIWYHGNRVNTVVAHENISLQAELDDINFQPDDKWAYVEDLLNIQPHWKPSEEQIKALKYALGKGGTYNKEALNSLLSDIQKLL